MLKWRANEFSNTHITSISVCETEDEKTPEDSNLAVATKNNQIMYVNLYKQVYFPDYKKMIKEMNQKSDDNGESDDSSANSDQDLMVGGTIGKIKCVGIQEEDIFADQAFKN